MRAPVTWSAKRWTKAGLLGIIVALMGTLLVLVLSGPSRRVPSVSALAVPSTADASLQEFSFVQSKDGRVDWRIQASQAQVFDAEAKAVLSDIQVTMRDAAGVSLTIEGDEGTINTSSKDFVIGKRSGNLALVFKSGYTVYTPRIHWTNQESRLWTDAPVRITGPRLEITGQGMDALLTIREMRIRRNVQMGIY
jgi:lipopolysaccharide export system protein LptC